MGIFVEMFSCSESVLSLILSDGDKVCKGNGVCWVNDFRCFRGGITAVATRPEVLNLWVFVVASTVLAVWIGFLILALELFVFLASCEIISAVSTSLWNVDLQGETLKEFQKLAKHYSPSPLILPSSQTDGLNRANNNFRFWLARFRFLLGFLLHFPRLLRWLRQLQLLEA